MNRAEHIKKNISVGGQMSETIMGLTYWKTIQFSFMAEKKQVKIDGKKDTIILDLRLYLVRKSQKYKDTLVF